MGRPPDRWQNYRDRAWEASMNNTYRAIDLIPKDVFICDWHYERAEQTAVYFAMKGFDVATCPWRKPQIALQQVDDMIHFRQHSNPEMSRHFQGIIETVWSGADSFLEAYYNPTTYKQEVYGRCHGQETNREI